MNLSAEMAKLPEPPDSPWPYWGHWRADLWRQAQANPPEDFVNWPCIQHTMLVRHWSMESRWDRLPDRYRQVIAELSSPLRENCIEQAWHLWQWESHDTQPHCISGLDTIVEFGGGYGQMCWLVRKLGFKGDYCIVDLPEFKLLQRWWLGTQGMETDDGASIHNPDLFIGCYSVSEIPPKDRRAALGDALSYLLAYSGKFDRWNNEAWFRKWGKGCSIFPFEDRPDWYLIC
jgi:hypothetical protein